MRSVSPDCPNFMDTSDSRFREMHSIVDTYFRKLRNEDVGASVKHASLKMKKTFYGNKVFMEMTPPKDCYVLYFTTMGKVLMASPAVGNHSHVHLLDKYLSKLHPKARELECFYMQPLAASVVSDPTKNWFSAQPCVENKLSSIMKNMFKMVGIDGKLTTV